MKAAVDYLDDTVPSGYSLRDYAEREKITSPEFRYLMNRCMDITGVAPKGLNDDEIAGYDMDEMAERVRLVHDAIFLTLRRDGEKLPEEAMNVVGSLNGYSLAEKPEEKEKSFKDAMGSWDAFFNAKLSNGKTVAEYAEENDLLSYGYEKLVRRAKEIAGIEVAEPVKQAEPQPELTDEKVAGLGMEDVADKLYGELVKLEAPLLDDYGEKWSAEAEKVDHYFIEYKGSDGFKKSVEEAQKFLDTPLSADKTIADYAKEKELLGKTFEKLMDRANEIAGMERQADQEQPELNDERSDDLDKSVVVQPPVRKTAAKWIEGYKADLGNRIKGKDKGNDYPAADIARIFAARELSNSVRGKKSTLNQQIDDPAKITRRAAEIMANKSFKDFAAKLSKGENLSKVEAIFKKTHSHGGELDDLFRDYLTKRPAGELENDPNLKRWMPTVKQRVEFLQKEAAKTQKENKTPYKEAAEILLLRQAADVKRGGKGLEANVPVAGDKGVKSLSEAVEKYADNVEFKAAFDKPDVKKYILAGHGGEMVERLKKQTEAQKIQGDQELGK